MRLIPLILVLTPLAANADVTVTFVEGAPKDQFILENQGCDLGTFDLTINLAAAPAGLIFDVTGSGAGVEVLQPVEVVTGAVTMTDVADGDQVLTLTITDFDAGSVAIISADIDDTQAAGALGQIRVAGSEIAGATLASPNGNLAEFDDMARAVLPTPDCIG
ncbi:hypothetical protein AB3Y40_04355 [Yoonia sp. R2331]|uniref:hypothetical protein n=1 Tax=Yoonia sp. R2331 TaxID=3237238 RepID=UPI0034E3E594